MTAITREYLDAVQADLDAAWIGPANEQHDEYEARMAAKRRVFDALDDEILPALRRVLDLRRQYLDVLDSGMGDETLAYVCDDLYTALAGTQTEDKL